MVLARAKSSGIAGISTVTASIRLDAQDLVAPETDLDRDLARRLAAAPRLLDGAEEVVDLPAAEGEHAQQDQPAQAQRPLEHAYIEGRC